MNLRSTLGAFVLTTATCLIGCGSPATDDGTAEFGGPDREKRQKMMEKNLTAEQKGQPAAKAK